MAVNDSRTMNRDFTLGATERKYKSLNPDRGGEVEPSTTANRADLDKGWFGRAELPLALREVPGRP